MIQVKEIDSYINLVEKGKIKVPVEINLLIENIVKPLLKSNVFFDKKTYKECIDYCETWYYPLFPFQKFFYALVFFYEDKEMNFTRFDEFLFMEGRGNGKDGLLAPLADYMSTPMYGVHRYNVEIAANSEKQARGTFDIIYQRMENNKDIVKEAFKISVEGITNLETNSTITFNSGNPKTADGKRPGMIIFNEIHEFENYNLISVYQSARGKVKHPRTFYITTDGRVRGAVLDDLKELAAKVLRGEVPKSRFLPVIYKLDTEDEIDMPEMWEKANPAINYMPNLKREIEETYEKMKHQPHLQFDFYVKRMNLPKDDESLLFTNYDNVLATNRPIPDIKGNLAIFAIDYAEIKDFAACGFLTKNDKNYIFQQHSWANERSPFFKFIKPPLREWERKGFLTIVNMPTIDINLIWDYFFEQCVNYNVQMIVIDFFRYELVKESAEKRKLTVWDKKYNPTGEIFLIRNGEFTSNFLAPFLDEIFANQRIICGDDPLMRWYINNTGIEITKKGNKNFVKIEPKLRKNDGFQALIHACSQREKLEVEEWNPNNNAYLK